MEHSEDGESKMQYFSTTDYSGGDMYDYNSEQPQPTPVASARPGIITFICILGFLAGAVGLFVGLLTDLPDLVGEWYRPFLVLGAVATTAGYVGVWMMKKWGLYLVTIMFAVGIIVSYSMNQWNPVNTIGSAIVLLVLYLHSNKMD